MVGQNAGTPGIVPAEARLLGVWHHQFEIAMQALETESSLLLGLQHINTVSLQGREQEPGHQAMFAVPGGGGEVACRGKRQAESSAARSAFGARSIEIVPNAPLEFVPIRVRRGSPHLTGKAAIEDQQDATGLGAFIEPLA